MRFTCEMFHPNSKCCGRGFEREAGVVRGSAAVGDAAHGRCYLSVELQHLVMVMLTSVERERNVDEGKGGPDAARRLTCLLLLRAGRTEARARVCAEGDASPGPLWFPTVGTSQSSLGFNNRELIAKLH